MSLVMPGCAYRPRKRRALEDDATRATYVTARPDLEIVAEGDPTTGG
jgi:hypothetical protein